MFIPGCFYEHTYGSQTKQLEEWIFRSISKRPTYSEGCSKTTLPTASGPPRSSGDLRSRARKNRVWSCGV